MLNKKESRLRRSRQTRIKIAELVVPRVAIMRTNLHISAQLYSACGTKVLASASTMESELRVALSNNGGNSKAATEIGKLIAERAIKAGVTEVAFDRSGFRYHGRVKALAEAAREAGLKF
jgi:large subunit ribosomal protein L18